MDSWYGKDSWYGHRLMVLTTPVCLSGSELNHTSRNSDLLGQEGPKYVFIELIKSDKVYLESTKSVTDPNSSKPAKVKTTFEATEFL